jgi:hypothetical protein
MAPGKTNHDSNRIVKNSIMAYLHSLYIQSIECSIVEHRWWYYGRMLHAIQDSYSDAHCARDTDRAAMPIRFFQNYVSQDGSKHAISDSTVQEDLQNLAADKLSHDQAAVVSQVRDRKPKLYRKALEMSTQLLDVLWTNTHVSGSLYPDNIWDKVLPILENVFLFDSDQYADSSAGQSLPEYAKDAPYTRYRDATLHSDTVAPDRQKQRVEKKTRGHREGEEQKPIAYRVFVHSLTAQSLEDADTFAGKSDGFFRMNVGPGHPFQSDVAHPDSKGVYRWLVSHSFAGLLSDVLYIHMYDSDTILGVPTPENSDHIGVGSVNIFKLLATWREKQAREEKKGKSRFAARRSPFASTTISLGNGHDVEMKFKLQEYESEH